MANSVLKKNNSDDPRKDKRNRAWRLGGRATGTGKGQNEPTAAGMEREKRLDSRVAYDTINRKRGQLNREVRNDERSTYLPRLRNF